MNAPADPPVPLRTLSTRVAWTCPYYRVRQDEFVTPQGFQGTYYVIDLLGGVWIIPLTDDGQVVLIRQYRHPTRQWSVELPAGGIRAGQTPEDVACAELKEEIGGTAERIEFFDTFHTMNSIGNERAHVFIASGVKLGAVQHEPTELLEILPVPLEMALEMARTNRIHDSRSAYALLLAESKLRMLSGGQGPGMKTTTA